MGEHWANWGELPFGNSVYVFNEINTARRSLFVLAKDKETAMAVACSSGHTRGTATLLRDYYSRNVWLVEPKSDKHLRNHLEQLERASSRRLQGTIHIMGDMLKIGNEII
jgi:hypothetical protein